LLQQIHYVWTQVEQIGAIMISTIRAASSISLSVSVQLLVFVGAGASAGLLSLTASPSTMTVASIALSEPTTVLRDTTTYQPPDNGGPDSTQGLGSR